MPNRYAIDVPHTFSGAMLVAVQPKLQPVNRDNPQGPMEQAKDKEGVNQWTVSLSMEVKTPDNPKARHENLDVTVSAPEMLYQKLRGLDVIVEGLEMGIMAQQRGGFSVFYSAKHIRPAQPVKASA